MLVLEDVTQLAHKVRASLDCLALLRPYLTLIFVSSLPYLSNTHQHGFDCPVAMACFRTQGVQ